MLPAAVTRTEYLAQKIPEIRHSKACRRTQEITCIMAGFAAGFDMAGFCATATSAPAVSPGPSGGTEITCKGFQDPLNRQDWEDSPALMRSVRVCACSVIMWA